MRASTLCAAGTALALLASPALGASVKGIAREAGGRGVEGVGICLLRRPLDSGLTGPCFAETRTDPKGRFALRSVDPGRYVVAIRDEGPGNRVWDPPSRRVAISVGGPSAKALRFQRRFGFANFQPEITVGAATIPELASFDPVDDLVFLRIFVVDESDPGASPTVLFLGQITSLDGLAIKLSLPWQVSRVFYEVYDPTRSVSGSIAIGG